MDTLTLLGLLAGGIAAGGVTAVAGGASFLTFPLLMAAGLPPLTASISNWVALIPGNFMALPAYRAELYAMRHDLLPHVLVSFVGGLIGTGLLLWAGEAQFERAVPWLLLVATLFFALGEWVKGQLDRWLPAAKPNDPTAGAKPQPRRRWPLLLFEFVLMVYGGYFGAGIGIMLLAALAMAGQGGIHEMNARKNLLVVAVSVAGLIVLLPSGKVAWAYAMPVFVGASIGGYGTVRFIRRIPAGVVRAAILTWAVVLTAVMFWKYG